MDLQIELYTVCLYRLYRELDTLHCLYRLPRYILLYNVLSPDYTHCGILCDTHYSAIPSTVECSVAIVNTIMNNSEQRHR